MRKVLVGMSGGVDSSTVAALLKKDGYEVYGVNLKFWECEEKSDDDAKKICDFLSIPYYSGDYSALFKEKVITPFINEYINGRTPNPCVMCNPTAKVFALCDFADKLGIEYIATGHYAKIYRDGEKTYLMQGENLKKDQSYFLYALKKEQLKRLLFPIGGYTKEEVRKIAEDFGIEVSKKPDSQEICFLPDGEIGKFIKEYGRNVPPEGYFVDTEGNPIGIHKGIYNYTIGQRKGLGAFGKPYFVREIDAKNNTVTIGDDILSKELITENFAFTGDFECDFPFTAKVKIRSRAPMADALIEKCSEGIKIIFDTPQRAVTPGQSAVLYKEGKVLGGGIIKCTNGQIQ